MSQRYDTRSLLLAFVRAANWPALRPAQQPRTFVVFSEDGVATSMLSTQLSRITRGATGCALVESVLLRQLHTQMSNTPAVSTMEDAVDLVASELVTEAVDRCAHLIIDARPGDVWLRESCRTLVAAERDPVLVIVRADSGLPMGDDLQAAVCDLLDVGVAGVCGVDLTGRRTLQLTATDDLDLAPTIGRWMSQATDAATDAESHEPHKMNTTTSASDADRASTSLENVSTKSASPASAAVPSPIAPVEGAKPAEYLEIRSSDRVIRIKTSKAKPTQGGTDNRAGAKTGGLSDDGESHASVGAAPRNAASNTPCRPTSDPKIGSETANEHSPVTAAERDRPPAANAQAIVRRRMEQLERIRKRNANPT